MLNESLKVNKSKFLENDLVHSTKTKTKESQVLIFIRFLDKGYIIQHSFLKLAMENMNFVTCSKQIVMIFPENTEHSSSIWETYLVACQQQNIPQRLCVISSTLRGKERIKIIETSNEAQNPVTVWIKVKFIFSPTM